MKIPDLLEGSKPIMKRRIAHLFIALFLVLSFPMSALADTTPDNTTTAPDATAPVAAPPPAPAPAPAAPTDTSSSAAAAQPAATTPPAASAPVPATSQGPSTPTGADSSTYTYNPTTGLWGNGYYTWDPATHQTSPVAPQDYSYNPATGMWDTTQYVYDAPSGKYVPNVVSSPTNPNQASSLQANNNVSNTGPGSTSTVNTNTNNNAIFDLFYNAKISNTLSQNATSGAAAVIGNTVGGSALSGNAMDVMNVINMLKSTFGLQNAADLMTFTSNINGNVVGDLYIDPNQLGPQSVAVSNSNTNNNVAINSNGSGLINNDITLGANSGNATVDSNTNAGSATTGNASAVANVVNMINSAIAANKSFLGVININGNLDGDILLPPTFLDQLLASNAPHATVNVSNNQTNNLALNSTNNESINNAVTLAAASGNANVANNTNAGSATTGAANTNLTVFNLTGKQVIAKDSILVFVNVLGQWVGLIMNAPTGTTAAAVGGNVTANNTLNNNVAVNSNTNNVIANNINVASKSGDAAVTNNTNAGDATSGNATASANIANIINSQLSASDWFGLLFINVLGTWHGSFGIDTDAGTIKQLEQVAFEAAAPGTGASSQAKITAFRFIPGGSPGSHGSFGSMFSSGSQNGSAGVSNTNDDHPVILASSVKHGGNTPKGTSAHPAIAAGGQQKQKIWVIPAASFAVVMLTTSAFGGSGELSDKLHARMLSRRLRRG
jgi:hypothetical protein